MGFRIKARDITVEVDNEEELRVALRVFNTLDEKATTLFHPEKPLPPRAPKVLSMEERMIRLYEDIQADHRKGMAEFIKALASSSEWIASAKLKENLTSGGSGLGGTLGAITKKAGKIGLKTGDVYAREESKEGIRYRLTDTMRKVVESKEPIRRAYPLIPQQKEGAEDM